MGDEMKKAKFIKPLVGTCMLVGAYYLINKNKKNMLDVIIEEIETMK